MHRTASATRDARDLVDRCSALSLDIFDTALLRRVDEPHEVFRCVGARCRVDDPSSTFDFKGARVDAELRARRLRHARSSHHEVRLDEIYDVLSLPAGLERAQVQGRELDLERALLVRNPYIHELYRAAIDRGVPVVFISDMYLPSTFLSSLLDERGYEQRDFLLVSAEADGASKASGGLYREAIRRLDVRPDEILHIGDNEHSDVSMALRNGLTAWHYRRCGELASRSGAVHAGRSIASSVARGLIHNELWAHRSHTPTAAYATGFAKLGLLWHHHHGDRAAVNHALERLPHVGGWRARLSSADAEDVIRGATKFHDEMTRIRSDLPWLEIPAVDAALALIDEASADFPAVDVAGGENHSILSSTTRDETNSIDYGLRLALLTQERDELRRRSIEYLAGWLESERTTGNDARADSEQTRDAVRALTSDISVFRTRFAPAQSLRARALDWTLRRVGDATHAAFALFDLRDSVLDQIRTRRR